tara:strand:- start:110 stop:304 length:195 start_codon:yes stop_codon:yes gene_type:complete
MNWSGYISESLKDIKVIMGRDINICINYPTPRGDQRETKNCLLNGGNNRWSPQRYVRTDGEISS